MIQKDTSNIPIDLLEVIIKIDSINSNIFVKVDDDNTIVKYRASSNPSYTFSIGNLRKTSDGTPVVAVQYKPFSSRDAKEKACNLLFIKVEQHFIKWLELITKADELSSSIEPSFVKLLQPLKDIQNKINKNDKDFSNLEVQFSKKLSNEDIDVLNNRVKVLSDEMNILSEKIPEIQDDFRKKLNLYKKDKSYFAEDEIRIIENELELLISSAQKSENRAKGLFSRLKHTERVENKKDKRENTITNAIEKLNSPNDYVLDEIKTQNTLIIIFGIVASIFCIILLLLLGHYVCQILLCDKTLLSIDIFKYSFPTFIIMSLVLTFIGLINKSIRKRVELKEKKRSIEHLKGTLLAISELSEEDEQRQVRQRINKVLDDLSKNAININERNIDISSNEDDYVPMSKLKDVVLEIVKGITTK